MSEENVELVLRAFSAWNDGDFENWGHLFDPGMVVIAPEGWPEGAEIEGFDAWNQQAERIRDTWEEARTEVDEIRAVGDDRVFAQIRYVTRGAHTDVSFDTPMAAIYTMKERKITRAHYFWDLAEARTAAGLSE